MLTLSPGVRVYVAPGATDMRKSFLGLAAATRQVLEQDPLSGHLFAFCNRRRTLLKILFWDGTGFWVLAKRLAKGTFAWPVAAPDATCVTLRPDELGCILGGLDLSDSARRAWWRREPWLEAAVSA